jgi:hypothetical protein
VVAAGDEKTTTALQAHILTMLSARQVHLQWSLRQAISSHDVLHQTANDEIYLAKIWLDVTRRERALLYIENTREDRFLLRTVPLEDGYDELARESLSNIVESAIDVLLAGGELGVTREEAEEQVRQDDAESLRLTRPANEKRDATPAQNPPQLSLLLGLRASTIRAADALQFGPELGAYLSTNSVSTWAFFGWFSGGYRTSTTKNDLVKLRIEGPGGRILLGARAQWTHFSWRLAAGAGLDASLVEAVSTGPGLTASEAFWVTTPVLSGLAAIEWKMGRGWFTSVAAGADLDLAGHRFDVVEMGNPVTVLSPSRVRPVVQLQMGYAFSTRRSESTKKEKRR